MPSRAAAMVLWQVVALLFYCPLTWVRVPFDASDMIFIFATLSSVSAADARRFCSQRKGRWLALQTRAAIFNLQALHQLLFIGANCRSHLWIQVGTCTHELWSDSPFYSKSVHANIEFISNCLEQSRMGCCGAISRLQTLYGQCVKVVQRIFRNITHFTQSPHFSCGNILSLLCLCVIGPIILRDAWFCLFLHLWNVFRLVVLQCHSDMFDAWPCKLITLSENNH